MRIKEEKLDFETQLDDLKKYFSDNIDDPHRFKSLLATPLIPTAPEMYILGMSEQALVSWQTRFTIRYCSNGSIIKVY